VIVDEKYSKHIVHRIRYGVNFNSKLYTEGGMPERLLNILVVVTGDSKDKNGARLQ
jgi:hypothetical protein